MSGATEFSHRMDALHVEGALSVNGGATLSGVRMTGSGMISVMEFGADPTGVADSTTAILAATAACQALAVAHSPVSTLLFPPGKYKLSSQWIIPFTVQVVGAGSQVSGTGGGTEIRWNGANNVTAIVCGISNVDWSGGLFSGFRLQTDTTMVSGYGIEVLNPTNGSLVRDVLVSGFASGQIKVWSGGAGPAGNFFRLERFFVIGGLIPLEIVGGRENVDIDYGGIDLLAASTCGLKISGAEASACTITVKGVKIEGSFDVPGFWNAGLAPTLFLSCTRYNFGSVLTSAGPAFLYDCTAQQSSSMTLISCGSLGCVVGFSAPGRSTTIPAVSAGTMIPFVLVAGGPGHAPVFYPKSATDASLVLQKDVVVAWTDSTGVTNALDTNLYRGAPNVLKTDDTLHAVLGVATMTKAGTPTDADWAVAPPVGTIVLDTTANKIWARTGVATWKGVVIA